MYKKQEHENEFIDFYLPFGGHLGSENRWVKLALLRPTESADNSYSGLRMEEQLPGMKRDPYALKCSIQKSAIF